MADPSLSNAESYLFVIRHSIFNFHVLDPRSARTMAKLSLEAIDGLGLAFRRDLDGTVRPIAYPAMQPFAASGPFRKETKADALHAAADHKSSRDAHR